MADSSVADPDPGSGAFLPPGSGIRDGAMVGSGIRCFFPPGSGIRIRDGAMVGSGSGIRDKTSRIRNTG
jgi:acetyltransferase-like isoleucine patch superfamily enzyme